MATLHHPPFVEWVGGAVWASCGRGGDDDDVSGRLPNPPREMRQVASTEFLVFEPQRGIGRALLYFLFKDQTVRQTLESMVTGTSKSHQRVSPPALLQSTLLVASDRCATAFEGVADPIIERCLSLRAENRTLAETRDYLLPRLMSGEVRVHEVAKEIAA